MAVQVDRKTASKKQLADKLQQLAARRGQARSKVAAKKHRSPKRVLKAARVAVDTSPVPPVLALQLRTRIQLSQPLFSRLLAVSVRSVAKLESGTPPTDVVKRRLNELSRLTNALAEVIRKESLVAWLQTPNSAFDGLKPLEVIERGESDRIWSMIFFLRSGVAS
jgi:DNA-binding transcriptional regulator YiaG